MEKHIGIGNKLVGRGMPCYVIAEIGINHNGDMDIAKKLIDAEKAYWVIGGNKPGVMTKQAKWAFEKKADAEKYIAESGGTLATFDEAMTAAFEGMYADTKMIREKRKMMKKQ